MKLISAFAILLLTATTAYAQPSDYADEQNEEAASEDRASTHTGRSGRQKRGAGPIVGLQCAEGYKSIGDDCVQANIAFE